MRLHHDFIWSSLIHVMTNWTYEEGNARGGDPEKIWKSPASPEMRFDHSVRFTVIDKDGNTANTRGYLREEFEKSAAAAEFKARKIYA